MDPTRAHQQNGAASTLSKKQVLERDQSQWLFTPTELLRTPSILAGMSVEEELANRQKGVNFITQVGIMLKLPQLTLATASVYLHRLFMRHAMPQEDKPGMHHYSVAATALFLATKVEENCRKMKELVVACCRVAQKQPNLVVDEHDKQYWRWRDTILHDEDLLLEALCFDLQLQQPYRVLFEFLQYYGVQDNKTLRNISWAFLNDSHVTTMCLLHSPRLIAGSALYAGVRMAGVTLPDDEQGRPWWEHLELDVLEIQRACNLMFEVYENPTLSRVGQKDAYIKEDDLAFFERTRQTMTPRPDGSPTQSARSGSQGTKRGREEGDGRQSEEWGASSTSPRRPSDEAEPSLKRQRRDSGEKEAINPAAGSRIPAGANESERGTLGDGANDVQHMIDQIVNANASTSNPGSRPPSTLVRRPSNQQQRHGPPPSKHSDSTSNSQGPPSITGSGQGDRQDRAAPPIRRPSSEHESQGSVGDSRKPPPPEPPPKTLQGLQPSASRYNGMDDMDDAEKVDYGSEEGEV